MGTIGALAVSSLVLPGAAVAHADESPAAATGETRSQSATVERIEKHTDRDWSLFVYSPSMDRTIELQVLRPADTSAPRPVFYLLNGAGGGQDRATWREQTDVVEFFGDKNVNVVTPIGGAFSYYTDWLEDDPVLGRNKWTTFLTEEVPSVVDATLGASGRNAIAGVSMSATSALALAQHAPDLYQGVGSYSGCAETATETGSRYAEIVVGFGGGEAENMWGPVAGEYWNEQDVVRNAEKLRGKAVYVSTSSGVPGPYELKAWEQSGVAVLPDVALLGLIEAGVSDCTTRLRGALDAAGVEATYSIRSEGTHTWGYWQEALHESWSVLGEAIAA
ncbi:MULTISPECIES: alpha/beta hydrolase family protein [Rhodococcus]|uniref:alpha/beta hydrolase n=1 Tax=Rhodococcus TaxID=1827 RepID=UPI0010203D34|nr:MULTISPECIES: alpha/beta hydrolase family protein [Rhodococcus]UTT47592.1 esterase family protein [Rhodococcus gordoniae]